MNKTILVLGGTGLLGQPVARRLVADGFQVRVLTRDVEAARQALDRAVALIPGEVAEKSSLDRAMAGCWGVHISLAHEVELLAAKYVAALAPELGIARIGYVSGTTVCEQNRWFPLTAQKLMAEDTIRQCGVPFTIFCPTWPMELLPRFARGGEPVVIGRQPEPLHWFAAVDMARMVSRAFQRPEAQNKRVYIHGPEAISMREALERYCKAFYPDGKPVSVMPIWVARGIAALTRNERLKYAATLMAYFEKTSELGDPTEANEILGPPEFTLADWIAQRSGSQASD